jgi:hypothetical protein
MQLSNSVPSSNDLPIRNYLKPVYIFSLLIAVLMGFVSVVSLLHPNNVYPTQELLESFLPNDVINLVIGLPILLGSMWFAWRAKLIGLLFWPGALFYVFYNYFVSLIGLPLNYFFIPYLMLVTASAYTTIALVASIDGASVRQQLAGVVPERVAGGILAGLGGLFALRVIAIISEALINQTSIPASELALLVTDFLVTPAWVIGGVLLWRRADLGYVVGTGLLFQSSMLFVGLIGFLFLQPVLTSSPLPLRSIIESAILGMICFVPFGLIIRGVVTKQRASRE